MILTQMKFLMFIKETIVRHHISLPVEILNHFGVGMPAMIGKQKVVVIKTVLI